LIRNHLTTRKMVKESKKRKSYQVLRHWVRMGCVACYFMRLGSSINFWRTI
jgi:hypothetical protein